MLQKQALDTIKTAVEASEHAVFPCALIAGDVVILELLAKLDYLKTGKVAVAFVDTFHLFPETITFLHQLEVKLCCICNTTARRHTHRYIWHAFHHIKYYASVTATVLCKLNKMVLVDQSKPTLRCCCMRLHISCPFFVQSLL